MANRESLDARGFAERVLREAMETLSRPELLVKGDVEVVAGWVELGSDGAAIRIVYGFADEERRFGYRLNTEALDWTDDSAALARVVADNIDEPFGRQWDLLVEEAGVWWWGDGHQGLDQHPDAPVLEAYVQAQAAHWLHGAPEPAYPFPVDLPPGATFEVTRDELPDPRS